MDKSNVMKGDIDRDGSVDENDGLKSLFKSCVGGNSKKAEKDEKPTSTDILSLSYLKEKPTPTIAENVRSSTLPSCYNMINEVPAKSRGNLVLIVNREFPKVKDKNGYVIDSTRKGAEVDIGKMKAIAKKMGFDDSSVSTYPQNLSKDEMENLLEDTRKADHSKCDCFLFMISSHGDMYDTPGGKEHGISTSDGQKILTREILEKFNDVNCPTLKDKPKIFIIQACRGDGLDDGVDMNILGEKKESETNPLGTRDSKDNKDAQTLEKGIDVVDVRHGGDSWQTTGPLAPPTPVNAPPVPRAFTKAPDVVVSSKNRITCDKDMLVLYAVPPGKYGWRSNKEGSWMIHYLHRIITDPKGRPDNFLKVLSRVASLMSERTTNTYDPAKPESKRLHEKKAVSLLEHNLSRQLII